MSKVIFFGYPAHGHINPTIGLVRELIARGEEVVYYGEAKFQSKIADTGAIFGDYRISIPEPKPHNVDSSEYHNTFDLNSLNKLFAGQMNLYTNIMRNPQLDLHGIIREYRPDYIIHDSLAYWGKILAKEQEIPAINSASSFAYCDQVFDIDPGFVIRDVLHLSGDYLKNIEATRRMLQRASKMFGSLYKIDGFDCIDMNFAREALNIVYISKEFQWSSESFDSSFKFVGPSIHSRNDFDDFDLNQLTEENLIYISFGTFLSNVPANIEFYHKCLDAFRNSRRQVVLTIGNMNVEQLGAIPPNFIVGKFLPQLEILKRAALFITHGGMNSVGEALYFNVPLIIIPQVTDQFLIANRVVELGAGLKMNHGKFSAQELSAAAEQVLANESYRRHSAKIGESLRNAGGYQRAADEIFAFKRQNNIH